MKVKNLVFSGAMASILMMGAAVAADKSDVTFDGKYSLSTDTEGTMSGTVASAPTAGQFTYDYVNYEGEQSDISSEHEIAYSEFKYTNSEKELKELTEDFEPEAQENYTEEIDAARTVDTDLKVMTDVTTLVSGTDPVVANYTYQRGDGEIKNLSDQPTFTETRTLLSDVEDAYADKISISNGTETISITNGTAETLDATWYTLNASNGQTYHLATNGSDVLNQMGEIAIPGEGLTDEFAALIQAYAVDSTAIAGFVTSTGESYSTAAVDYEAAMAVFEEDKESVTTLNNNFASQATAQKQYKDAVDARDAAIVQFDASTENYNLAKSVYSAPILGTIDSEADTRIEMALGEDGAITAKLKTKQDSLNDDQLAAANSGITAEKVSTYDNYATSKQDTLNDAQLAAANSGITAEKVSTYDNYATSKQDTLNDAQLAAANSGITAEKVSTYDNYATSKQDTLNDAQLAAANSGITAEKVSTYDAYAELIRDNSEDIADLGLRINEHDDAIAALQLKDNQLRNDIDALDSKVNDLDENLSAGIASSVALSAVEVSNVKKGEMSVGGGYGNYNSKSAMAFGAALGITDNWSANAGVGLGFGKDTKASFRIGTNYKFKLF